MSLQRKIKLRTAKRILRNRRAVKAKGGIRISVFRSARHIYAQCINDSENATLASSSSLVLEKLPKGDKKDIAKAIGLDLAKKILAQGITRAVFDRGQFLYHGRVKSLAEGLREGGLEI